MKAGIVGPTTATRFALQDATSVAGLLVTTEAMVCRKSGGFNKVGYGGGRGGRGRGR